MADTPSDDSYSEEETVARREAALKRMLATPPKPHKAPTHGDNHARNPGKDRP